MRNPPHTTQKRPVKTASHTLLGALSLLALLLTTHPAPAPVTVLPATPKPISAAERLTQRAAATYFALQGSGVTGEAIVKAKGGSLEISGHFQSHVSRLVGSRIVESNWPLIIPAQTVPILPASSASGELFGRAKVSVQVTELPQNGKAEVTGPGEATIEFLDVGFYGKTIKLEVTGPSGRLHKVTATATRKQLLPDWKPSPLSGGR